MDTRKGSMAQDLRILRIPTTLGEMDSVKALKTLVLIVPFGLLAVLQGCTASAPTQSLPLSSTRCVGTEAQIAVYDGLFQNLCGCQEAGASPVGPGTLLTCTVATGTTLFFQYPETTLKHQILSSDGTGALVSPVSDPEKPESVIRSYAIKLDRVGTYLFTDAFNTGLTGKIIVF